MSSAKSALIGLQMFSDERQAVNWALSRTCSVCRMAWLNGLKSLICLNCLKHLNRLYSAKSAWPVAELYQNKNRRILTYFLVDPAIKRHNGSLVYARCKTLKVFRFHENNCQNPLYTISTKYDDGKRNLLKFLLGGL